MKFSMSTSEVRDFAREARRQLINQVGTKLLVVLAKDSLARRENPSAVAVLEEDLANFGSEELVERVAYTWFNRISALRFMDVNNYTSVGIVSPATGQTQPEILADAKMGHIDEKIPENTRRKINDLLTGVKVSSDPQQEAYKLLFIAHCNLWHSSLSFLFERIQDYSELLLPEDLLSEQSIITKIQSVLSEENCNDVEIVGWLYQHYISEKKEEVDRFVNRNGKLSPSNLPAATQLFTPRWIVRYLVENSLGWLWMLNYPNSKLTEKMQYYSKPVQAEVDFLHLKFPEEIRVCDPACGSGHMLVYAFDLLYEIYAEQGYDEEKIPELILTRNLFGIEIDKRAADLAAFALTMKARRRDRHFFNKNIQPNICVLNKIAFQGDELHRYVEDAGQDVLSLPVINILKQFEEVDNFGSLIRVDGLNVQAVVRALEARYSEPDLSIEKTHKKVMNALHQASYLTTRFHVVVTNPPYAMSGNLNVRLVEWLRENYWETRADLFAAFIERSLDFAFHKGLVAMITMQSWMFLVSYEEFRNTLIHEKTIISLVHLGTRAFDSIKGEKVSTSAFVLQNRPDSQIRGSYFRIVDGKSEEEKEKLYLRALNERPNNLFYEIQASTFLDIPESLISYWSTKKINDTFADYPSLSSHYRTAQGLATGKNKRFLRLWHECSLNRIGFSYNDATEANCSLKKWFPYNKGGAFRKWYGNQSYVVDWENDGHKIRNFRNKNGRLRSRPQNMDTFFKESISWSKVNSNNPGFRYFPPGFIYDVAGTSLFVENKETIHTMLGLCNSSVVKRVLEVLSPTMNFEVGQVSKIPINLEADTHELVEQLIEISKRDWDAFETSWSFARTPLLDERYHDCSLENTYLNVRTDWRNMTNRMLELEEANNLLHIDAYALDSDVSSAVSLYDVSINCNPFYRYGGDRSANELEARLLKDSVSEFISYSVGCMFGRYSLDKPGLILANQGDNLADYLEQVPNPSFMPDENNVIPVLRDNWFVDDVTGRFMEFLKVTFGEERFLANLQFIESAIGQDIRSYFLEEFYKDHIKRFRISSDIGIFYWMFSSPRGTFNALVYMHRYHPNTINIVLNKYLRELQFKLRAKIEQLNRIEASAGSSEADKAKAAKERSLIQEDLDELHQWEQEVIFPLAAQRIKIDLDDGVRVNYPKFGTALKEVKGLSQN